MVQDFVQLVRELFPSIDPYTGEQAMESIKRFMDGKTSLEIAAPLQFPYLAQGDVIGPLHFSFVDPDGNWVEDEFYGLLLSNTCDCDRDDLITFCACYPLVPLLEEVRLNVTEVRKNKYSSLFYLADKDELVADFTFCNSVPRPLIMKHLESGRLTKLSSLTDFGYYFLLAKLTYHYMRPEDPETNASRPPVRAF